MWRRVLTIGLRLVGWAAALLAVEAFGAMAAFSFWIVLLPLSPLLVVGGLVAGAASLVVGALRRRPAGCADDRLLVPETTVHAILLANALLLLGAVAAAQWRSSISDDAWWWVLGATVTTGSVALLGIPVAVWVGWRRALGPRRPPGHGTDVVRLSSLLNSVVAIDLVATTVWSGGAAS